MLHCVYSPLTSKGTAQPLADLRGGEDQCDDNAGNRNEDADEGEYFFLGPSGAGCIGLGTLRGVCLRWRDWYGMYHEDMCEEGEHKAEVWKLRRHQEVSRAPVSQREAGNSRSQIGQVKRSAVW
jgi:hypothetical protein